jgi:outer membrane protein assembly factor BamB
MDTSSSDYFTSFDQTGTQFFLEYIPWLYNRLIVVGAPIQQSSAQALSGPYSAYFYQDLISGATTSLETQNLPIPIGSASVMLAGWFYVGRSDLKIEVHILIDGQDHPSTWTFDRPWTPGWVYRSYQVDLPPGANTFYGWIRLKSVNDNFSANHFWLDDYSLDFIPAISPALEELLVGDIGGNLYAINTTTGAQNWSYSSGGGLIGWVPALANSVAFFGTSGSSPSLYAVNARTGALIWSKSVPTGIRAQPAILGTSCMVCSSDGYLRSYRTTDGLLQWELNVLNLSRGTQVDINGTLLEGNVLYLTTDMGVGAVDVVQRQVLWGAQQSLEFPYPPEVGGGVMYAGCKDGKLYAFNAVTGDAVWTYATGVPVQSQPQYLGGVVIFGSDDGNLYGVNGTTGALVWKLAIPGAAAVRSFLYSGGMLYVISNAINGGLYAYGLNIDNSQWAWTKKWQAPLTNGSQADPAVYADQVFVTASNSTVYAYDTQSGTQQWAFKPTRVAFAGPGLVVSSPAFDTSRRFDQVCWLGTHNAYANSEDGWWYAQQTGNIISQLDDGVRLLMLDIWNCPSNSGAGRIVHAHEGCGLSWLLMPFSSYILFSDCLSEIRAWLDSNPMEIVTIYLEQRVGDKTLIQNTIAASNISSYFFYADRPNVGPNGTWNVQTQGWPTLAWMLAANKRLVIFSDWGKYSPFFGDDGLPYVWTWAVENDYGTPSSNGQCNSRAGSSGISTNPPALFIMNYNSDFSANRGNELDGEPYYIFEDYNDFYKILGIVEGCAGLRAGRLPNFLAVDWYEFGKNGGSRKTVQEINARLALQP